MRERKRMEEKNVALFFSLLFQTKTQLDDSDDARAGRRASIQLGIQMLLILNFVSNCLKSTERKTSKVHRLRSCYILFENFALGFSIQHNKKQRLTSI